MSANPDNLLKIGQVHHETLLVSKETVKHKLNKQQTREETEADYVAHSADRPDRLYKL